MATKHFQRVDYKDAVRRIGEREARWNSPWARVYRQKNLELAVKHSTEDKKKSESRMRT